MLGWWLVSRSSEAIGALMLLLLSLSLVLNSLEFRVFQVDLPYVVGIGPRLMVAVSSFYSYIVIRAKNASRFPQLTVFVPISSTTAMCLKGDSLGRLNGTVRVTRRLSSHYPTRN